MAMQPRLNKIIDLMEQGKPAFGTFVSNGNLDEISHAVDLGFDFVFIENEHVGMDFSRLRVSLQFLLDREKLVSQGNLQADPTPMVRISPNAEDVWQNHWAVKQTLDHGVYGLLLPRLETVEQARAAVTLCRYPQHTGVPDFEPEGIRGWGPKRAARYWGLGASEYYEVADLWPLDPNGELLLMGICESVKGVKNLPDILDQVKGVGAILAGPGDLSASMGLAGMQRDPSVQGAVLTILKTCQEYGVPCAINATTPEEVEMRLQQGFRILNHYQEPLNSALDRAREIRGD